MNPSSRFELAAFYHGVGTAITEKTPLKMVKMCVYVVHFI
jgi:hypothetical protein